MVEANRSRITVNKKEKNYDLSYIKEIRVLNNYYNYLIKVINKY
jgi:hypothetical protein